MNKDKIIEFIDDIKGVKDDLPYVGSCSKAFNFFKRIRMKRFLKTLNNEVEKWPEKERKHFNNYIESKVGQTLLADYIDTTLLTSSKIAQAALALLYSDITNVVYSMRFKMLACQALRGCTDHLVEVFLLLISLDFKEYSQSPYIIRSIHQGEETQFPELFNLLDDPIDIFTSVNDLIRRSILLPDYAGARLGDENHWSCLFGISKDTQKYHKLLSDAKQTMTGVITESDINA